MYSTFPEFQLSVVLISSALRQPFGGQAVSRHTVFISQFNQSAAG